MNGIEDVLIECIEENSLILTEENRLMNDEFINRQLKIHKDYDLNKDTGTKKFPKYLFVSLLSDEVYYFSIYMRQTEVEVDMYSDRSELVDSKDKLRHMQLFSSEISFWSDETLFNIYRRRNLNGKKSGMIGSMDILNELGKDPEVVKLWGREVVYENDIGGRRRDMRKLTLNLEVPGGGGYKSHLTRFG